MIMNCKKDSLIQIKKKDQHYYLSELTEDNLNALQKNIKKGLKESHTVKNASQSTAVTVHKKIDRLQSVTEIASKSQAIVMPQEEKDLMNVKSVDKINDN